MWIWYYVHMLNAMLFASIVIYTLHNLSPQNIHSRSCKIILGNPGVRMALEAKLDPISCFSS